MKYSYRTKGVCSSYIEFEMDGNVLVDANFVGGCNGNLKGICSLCKGMTYEQISERLSGITCGRKNTSCPDQLVKAMKSALESDNQ